MNQKEINELRRRFRPEKSTISRVYGCYVNSSKEIVSDLDESLGMMPQEESEKYLSLLKKGLSGSLGKNLIDIVFSTQQVADSEGHRLLTTLRDSQLKDNEARQTFYRKVINSLDMGDSSYLLLLACDSYDVPHRGKDDSLQADASDEVFTYIVCVVCPIKEGKVELGYFPGDNEFHCAAGQTVASPELGFLFPAFDDRAANIYNALFYSRKANEIHQEFIDAIFHVEAPMSAVEQKEAFQSALSDAFDCSLEVMQTVHEQLREKIKEHRESRSSEPLEMSASEIGQILQSCGIADEQVAAFQENCGEQFGSGVVLNPANLIDSSRFEIKTPEITISADPEYSYLVETQIIEAVHSQKLSGALQLLKGRRQSDLRCFALYTNRAGVFHPYPENAVQSLVLQKFRCLFLHIIAAGIFSSMLFPVFSPHTGIIDIGLEAIRKWCDPFVHKVDAQF